MSIKLVDSAGPLSSGDRMKLTGVPFTAEHKERVAALEKARGEISMKLSAVHEESERVFLEKAAASLGLNPLQAEQVKPDLFRLVSGLDKLKGVDIPKYSKGENLASLILILFGGVAWSFLGSMFAEDAVENNQKSIVKGIFLQRRNLDKLEASLMETLKLSGGDGRAELRKRMEAFLVKELSPEAAESYKALSTVKVFDPMQSFSNWLKHVFGGKDKLMSIAKSVKSDVDKAIPDLVASALRNDNAGAKKSLERLSNGLLARHRQDIRTALGAIREQVPNSVKPFIDEHISGLGAPSLKALPKAA